MSNSSDLFAGGCVIFIICLNIIILLICIFDYKDEDLLINAIEKTWKNYPIFNLSLTPLEGYEEIIFMKYEEIDTFCDCINVNKFNKIFKRNCNEYEFISGCLEYSSNGKATKIYNSSIYAKYYEADYMTLFNRIKNGTLGVNCKEEFERCGYLDLKKNTFCIKRGEICPINSNISFNFGDDGKISKINFDRNNRKSYILNRLYVSEVEEASIFDINKFYHSSYEKYKKNKDKEEKFYLLGKILNYKNIFKNEFCLENRLVKGTIPESFKSTNIYLYHLIYPANAESINLGEFALFILKKPNRYIFKGIFLIVKIISLIIFCLTFVFYSEGKGKIILNIIHTIITILFLFFSIINIIYIKQKYNLHKILYNANITSGSGKATFVIQIIFEIIPDLIFCLIYISFIIVIIIKKAESKQKNNGSENSNSEESNIKENENLINSDN